MAVTNLDERDSVGSATPPPAGGGADHRPPFEPYIAASTITRELTPLPLIVGTLLGVVFGASSLYLVLKVGLTVSASIPVAVISITLFRLLSKFGLKDATILENNIVQTAGSAGESIAFGLGVTMPAIMILGFDLEWTRTILVAVLGGLLGILMMIPLRRALIVQQHGILKYPEGTACAEVLKAGASEDSRALASPTARAEQEKLGGAATSAATIFSGFGIGFVYKALNVAFKGWKDVPEKVFGPPFAAGSVSAEISPELLGVGYIIGPYIASIMCAGGVLAYLVLIPAIKFFGSAATTALAPGTIPISEMSPGDIRNAYVLYIGAGAVAAGGIVSLLRSLPTIWAGMREGLKDFQGGAAARASLVRTDRDLSMKFVYIGSIILVVAIMLARPLHMNLLGACLLVVLGFLFVTVSSRLTGEVGSTSNPISGMTIATLMGTCLVFITIGWRGDSYQAAALLVGSVVCIASANAGATSQDLKTGFLVGATPYKQQIGLMIGVVVSVLVIGGTLLLLDRSIPGVQHAIGTEKFPAPQSMLMATMIKGQLSQQLPWGPVLVGVFMALMAQLAGAHALSWAVGAYLPLSTTAPIFVGGMVRWLVNRRRTLMSGGKAAAAESDIGPGMLYATGLVAGGSLAGMLIAFLQGFAEPFANKLDLGHEYWTKLGLGGDVIAAGAFFVLSVFLIRQALSDRK